MCGSISPTPQPTTLEIRWILAVHLAFFPGCMTHIKPILRMTCNDQPVQHMERRHALLMKDACMHFVIPTVTKPYFRNSYPHRGFPRAWDKWTLSASHHEQKDATFYSEKYCIAGSRNIHKTVSSCSENKCLGPEVYIFIANFLLLDMGSMASPILPFSAGCSQGADQCGLRSSLACPQGS